MPVASCAQGWQRCVLRLPPSDAVFPLVGAVSQCWNRLAVCNGVPGCSGRGASSIACGGRRWGGNRGPYPLGRLGPQYVPFGCGASNPRPRSTPWPGPRICWTSPPPTHSAPKAAWEGGGGGLLWTVRSRHLCHATPTSFRRLLSPPGTQGSGGGGGASLLSTPVTAPGLREGGGVNRDGPGGSPQRPVLSSRVAVGSEGIRGRGQLHAWCSKRGGGPLEWWAVPCVYRRARLARRWRWVLQRRGAGLMLLGFVWPGVLEWPEPEPRLARQRSAGGSAQRSG